MYQAIEQANNQFITLKTHRLSTKDLKHLYIEVNLIYNKKKFKFFSIGYLSSQLFIKRSYICISNLVFSCENSASVNAPFS